MIIICLQIKIMQFRSYTRAKKNIQKSEDVVSYNVSFDFLIMKITNRDICIIPWLASVPNRMEYIFDKKISQNDMFHMIRGSTRIPMLHPENF